MNCKSCGQNMGNPIIPLAPGISTDEIEIRSVGFPSDYKQMATKFVQWMNANVCGGFVDELPNALKNNRAGSPLVT